MLGQLQPDQGTVKLGTNLQVAYFDQLRDTLDPDKTVQENVGDGTDKIQIGDKSKHIVGYLQDFLFTPERARTQVRYLSGGERNRALLAKLMTRPANVMVLDEPTNDLDSETLELLEEQLADFNGTLLIVSHDRTFLNQVVTSTLVFEEGRVNEYVGGYDEWQAAVQRRSDANLKSIEPATKAKSPAKQDSSPAKTESLNPSSDRRKLSYKERRELDELPAQIQRLEASIAQLHTAMAEPGYYQLPGEKIADNAVKLSELEQQLIESYQRWENLEAAI
jgi:ATP-binding cassette subfamily F protein uup